MYIYFLFIYCFDEPWEYKFCNNLRYSKVVAYPTQNHKIIENH